MIEIDNIICPNCGQCLNLSIKIIDGQPVIKNVCIHCGYDSSKGIDNKTVVIGIDLSKGEDVTGYYIKDENQIIKGE